MNNNKAWYSLFLKSWQPVPTVRSTVILFGFVGINYTVIYSSHVIRFSIYSIRNYFTCLQ